MKETITVQTCDICGHNNRRRPIAVAKVSVAHPMLVTGSDDRSADLCEPCVKRLMKFVERGLSKPGAGQ